MIALRNPILNLGFILGAVAAGRAIFPVRAETVRGKILTSENVTLDYVYESNSNSFALDPSPLFHAKMTNLKFTAVPQDKCDSMRAYFKEYPQGLDAASIQAYSPTSSMSVAIQLSTSYRNPDFTNLVQDSLKKQGKMVSNPKNATHLDRISVQLGFRWMDRALSVLGKNDLQTRAQKPLLSTWSVKEDDSGIRATANDPQAISSMVCDLQEKNLTLAIAYEYQNKFSYFDHGSIQGSTLFSIWNQLKAKSKWIDDIAASSEYTSQREARLIAASSLLTLEILKTPSKASLLQADQYMTAFSTLFNTPTVEVKRFFTSDSADELADRLGKSIDINLNAIKGSTDL